ncbi:MAG: amidophosphoribosyltransferase [Patescibacteria group bacterium]
MCGIVGIYGQDYVAQDIYDALITLQHRGQDAAGMITYDKKFHVRKDLGLVQDVFHTRHMKDLTGYVGIGFNRYATIGTGSVDEVMPFYSPSPFGVTLVFNGNVFNAPELKKEIFEKDHRLVNSDSDGEVMLNIFTKSLSKQNIEELKPEHVWKAVESVYKRCKGAYSVIGYIAKLGMFAFRDPYGIRPLVFGKRKDNLNPTYMFASESVALDILGYEFEDDVGHGEAIFIEEGTRKMHRKKILQKKFSPCLFEYVYLARPDSILNGISVYKSRMRMGKMLARKIKKAKLDIDCVMPVPDSARTSAFAIADELKIQYREGLVKNRYIGRTFIMPGQKIRKKSIRYKLNPMPLEIKGKKILLVDDSIVRGNTSRQIIEMVRGAGAKKVYFASYSPQIVAPNLYGIDIATKDELIAVDHSVEEIGKLISADALFYGDMKDVFEACVQGNPKVKDLDMSCFDGRYITGDVTKEVLKKQAASRNNDRNVGEVERETFGDENAAGGTGQLNLL